MFIYLFTYLLIDSLITNHLYIQTVAMLRALPFPILAVIAGAETGVELADRLSR